MAPHTLLLEISLVGRCCTGLHTTARSNKKCCLSCSFNAMLASGFEAHNNFGSRRSPVRIRPARPPPARPNTVSRSPVPSTPSSARTASVTGVSVSSSGSSGAPASAEPVAAASLTARSASDNSAADPLHPAQVRTARVRQRAEQSACRGQHTERAPAGRERRRQGTQIASAGQAISGHGTGARRGRTTSASHPGTTTALRGRSDRTAAAPLIAVRRTRPILAPNGSR